MRITIDNEDGQGAKEYTAAVSAEAPIKLERKLNAPSRCTAEIVPGLHGLPSPVRRARVVVASDAGTLLFTGYLTTEPVPVYAGSGLEGPVYRLRIQAVSDEWLLDKPGLNTKDTSDGLTLATTAEKIVNQITQAAQGSLSFAATTQGVNARALGAFAVQPAAGWSTNAAAAANAAYAAYRVVDETVTVSSAGAVTHVFEDTAGTLNPASLQVGHLRELANDVTISGAEEPTAYVQEIFQGDGTTTEFVLSHAAFRGSERQLLRDDFSGAGIDLSQWSLSDGGSHLQLTGAGLTMSGGNGFDGQTTLKALRTIEMSGSILIELGGVVFGAGSSGMLAAFYNGTPLLTNCFAGFRIRQSVSESGGVTVVVPVMNGAEVGSAYTPIAGHRYTLRLRLHCAEMQRVAQRYYCMVDGAVQGFGDLDGVSAPMHASFEIADEGVSSNTPSIMLFDTAATGSAVTESPAVCSFVAVNAVSLYGSVASLEVMRPGSMWIVSTLPDGRQETRSIGAVGQGVDCMVDYGSAAGSAGKITFFAGRIPIANERLTVHYRMQRRAVARLADTASVAAETAAGAGARIAGLSRWFGKVLAPVARSSADCEAAALAVLAMATSRSAAQAGSFETINPGADIWPGDLLQLITAGQRVAVLIRSVEIEDAHTEPEMTRYRIAFANDWATEWADGLGLRLSDAIASDATLPATAESGPGQVLNSLQQMLVTSLTAKAVLIDAGVAPPPGGGFEVRRRDWAFGVGVDGPDLVLRSPVRNFSIPRSQQREAFFIRTYDASTPPVYSRFSSALLLNWPVA